MAEDALVGGLSTYAGAFIGSQYIAPGVNLSSVFSSAVNTDLTVAGQALSTTVGQALSNGTAEQAATNVTGELLSYGGSQIETAIDTYL